MRRMSGVSRSSQRLTRRGKAGRCTWGRSAMQRRWEGEGMPGCLCSGSHENNCSCTSQCYHSVFTVLSLQLLYERAYDMAALQQRGCAAQLNMLMSRIAAGGSSMRSWNRSFMLPGAMLSLENISATTARLQSCSMQRIGMQTFLRPQEHGILPMDDFVMQLRKLGQVRLCSQRACCALP